MSRMKTFFKYAMWIILFFVFSEILIYMGLNSSYRNISRKDNTKQVQIMQAQATLVNGRMKGKIKWDKENPITSKYVKVDFYSKRDLKVGTKYIDVTANEANPEQDFSIYFEEHDIRTYKISVVDEKDTEEIKIFPEEMSRRDIILLTFLTMLVI